MAIREVIQKMADYGADGITDAELEEVKQFAKLYPSAKASLSKMLDYGADGVSDDEFKNVDTWSRPKLMEAKQKANSYIDPLDAAAEKERQGGVLSTLGGAAKDAGISLAVQGSAGIAGQIGTLIGNDPLNATVGSLQRTYLPEGLPQKLPLGLLSPVTATTTGLKAAGSLLPEGLQDAFLVNPDNWLTRGARKVSQSAQESKTALQKQAERDAQAENKAAESGSIGDQVSTALSHPQSIAAMGIQSAPQLLVGGLAGRGARALLGASEYAVGKVAAATGSSMQAADSWQNTYYNLLDHPEQIEETPEYQKLISSGLSKDIALRKVARNHADDAMAMAGAASVLTTMLPGGNAIEQRLAGVASNPGSKAIAARIGAAGVALGGETIQEGSEEASAQMASNLSERSITGASPMEGVVSAGTLGSVLGAAFSGPVAAGKLVPGKAEADPATPAPLAGPVPTAQAPAVSTPPIPQTQPTISSANMTAKQKGVEQDFEALAQNPVLAPHIDEWRKQNPNGEANQFLDWRDSQPKIQAAQAVSQHPEVIQASQEATAAEEKAQVAQQVQTADPTQGPLPGLTVEEMQDVQQNGTAKLDEKAKAAREQARTVAQTKAKEIEEESSQADEVKTAREDLKKAQKERKTQAKEAFSAKLKAMQDGAVEWDEKAIKAHAEDAGISPEAVTAKIASARARYAKMKAAERASGKKAPKPKPAAKPEAEFTQSPVQGEQETGPVSPTLSDVDAFVEEAAKVYLEQGGEAAFQFAGTAETVFPGITQEQGVEVSKRIRDRVVQNGVPFKRGWTPQKPATEAQDGPQAETGVSEAEALGAPESSPMGGELGAELAGGTGLDAQERIDSERPSLASVELGEGVGVDGGVDGGTDGIGPSANGVDADVVESARVEHALSPATDGGNFNATDENLQVEKAGSVAQFNAHMAAIRLVKKLLAENRKATPEEKLVLGKWNGWGPLSKWIYKPGPNATASDVARHNELKAELTKAEMDALESAGLNSHYTSPEVVDAMWNTARSLGFRGGIVLEPSMGSGIFFGRMPRDLMDNSKLRGVELEPFTAAIAGKLYDVADIQNTGFERYRIPSNSVSLAITNVPFGNMAVSDSREDFGTEYIHNFFIKKIIDKLAPGGIAILISGKGSMDANARAAGGPDFRSGLESQARFLGSVRLPETAFKGSASTKVVTDVLVFQKRAEGDATPSAPWKDRKNFSGQDLDGNSVEMAINEYYLENPSHVLGKTVPGSLYGEVTQAAETTVVEDGRDIPAELERILSGLQVDRSVDSIETRTKVLEDASLRVDDEVPPKSILVKDGRIFMVTEKGRAEPYEMSPAQSKVMIDSIPVREALNALTSAQLKRADNVDALREKLNKAYDEFVKKHGSIHKNKRTVDHDQAYSARLKSLEVKAEDGSWKKAPIFTENTQKKAVAGKPQTPHEALALSLDRNGRVDLDFMAEQSGIPVSDLRDALEGRLFEDPETGGILLDEQYLCGDIAGKMAIAKAKGMDRNVDALRAVAPEEIMAEDVSINFGQTWIPAESHNAFLRDIGANVTVTFNDKLGKWTVVEHRRVSSDAFQFGGEGYSARDMVEWVLNGKAPMVTFVTMDGERILDKGKTAVAGLNAQAFRRAFSEWMINSPEKSDFVKERYNRTVNVWSPAKSNGQHMTFPGMNPDITLRDSQKDAAWRGVSSDFPVYLHHEVGTGKTAIFAAIAMELRRTGKANKPVYLVPKHLMSGVGNELRKFYPGGKFLVLTDEMVDNPKKRGEALAQAATGDWDMVVVSHDTSKLISLSPKVTQERIQQEMDYLEEVLREMSSDKTTVRDQKNLRKKLDKMKQDITEMAERAKKDPGPFWDEMGFDALMVDEAHGFKNLFTPTTRRESGIAVSDSQKAFDMFLKTQQMHGVTGGKHIIFGTGTPVTRSMVELHIWMRYLMPGVLKKMGVYGLDQFIALFGKEHSSAVQKVSGQIKVTTQLTSFVNLKPLISAWSMMSDRATAASAKIARPKVVGGKPQVISVGVNHVVQSLMDVIVAEIQAVEAKRSNGNLLELMTRSRKVGIDPRLLDPRMPDLPESKINVAIGEIFDKFQESKDNKGTQIVWLDMGVPKSKATKKKVEPVEDLDEDEDEEAVGPINLYQDIKDKLVARGVPAEEIQFIHDHPGQKKDILCDKLRRGDVRILIASRAKAATGMNVQDRIYWMHHIDAQWNPAEMEQANGRGIRYGNSYSEVGISYYTQQGTLDAYFWQTLERKAKIIENFFSGNLQDRTMEDMGMGPVTASQAKAATSNDPDMFRFIEVEREYEEISQAKAQIEKSTAAAKRSIPGIEASIENLKQELSVMDDTESEYKPEDLEISGTKDLSSGDIAKIIRETPDMKEGSSKKLGTVNGIPVMLKWSMGSSAALTIQNGGRKVESKDFTKGAVDGTGINKALKEISPATVGYRAKAKLQGEQQYLEILQEKASKQFKDEARRQELEAELARLTTKLSNGTNAQATGSKTVVDDQIRQPDDGAVLADIQSTDFSGVRKRPKNVREIDSVPSGSVPAEIVGTVKMPGAEQSSIIFRAGGKFKTLSQSEFMVMANGDTAWSIATPVYGDPYLVSETADGKIYKTSGSNADNMTKLSDYVRRLERMPEQVPGPEILGEGAASKEIIIAAARTMGVDNNSANKMYTDFVSGLRFIDSAAGFAREMGDVADLGVAPSIAQLNAFAERGAKASKNVALAVSMMLPVLELIGQAEAVKATRDSLNGVPPVRKSDIQNKRDWRFAETVWRIAKDAIPGWKGDGDSLVTYFSTKFKQATGKDVWDASVTELENWAKNRVVLNANQLPGWAWAAMGGVGAILAGPGNLFGDIGAFDAIAVGLASAQLLRALRWAWGKLRGANSPRTQILKAHSTAKWGADYILEMLDQAFLRAMEIKGPAMAKIRALRKALFSMTGKEKHPGLGREISNRISGRGSSAVPGMTEDQISQATAAVASIFKYFRGLMENLGMPVRENYVPIMYHYDGFKEAMADPDARDRLVNHIADQVEKSMPDSVQKEMDAEKEESRDWNEARRRRPAAIKVAESIIATIMGEGQAEKLGFFKEYTSESKPGFTKKRSLPFEIMEEVEGVDGRMIPLVNRNAFDILTSYIPKMSRAIAHREVVNTHRINQWLDGLVPVDEEDQKLYRDRMLNYVKNDLNQSVSRVIPTPLLANLARQTRILNTTRFLGLSPWYMMRNLMFGVPLAFGLTGFRGGASFAGRSLLAFVGGKKEDAALVGAITEGIFHDVATQEGSKVGKTFDLVNAPAAWSQEAVDVGGFYAGRAAAPKLFANAKKGDAESKQILAQALGSEGANLAIQRGVLSNEEMNRIGLYFKTKISGTARSMNLPSFMGTDLGRTLFQFGSIPMEQTKTLVEDVFDSGSRFMLNAKTGKYMIGAAMAGSAMIAKLWAVDALAQMAGSPESDRKKWLQRSSIYDKAIYAMMESGAFQLLQPIFSSMDDYKKNTNGGLDNYLPMPTASVASFAGSVFQGIDRTDGMKPNANPVEAAAFVLTPAVRDLVNRQTSLFRGFGIKIPNRTRLEKRIEKKD